MAQIYETIYQRLEKIGILAAIEASNVGDVKLEAPGFMDLHVDLLRREGDRVIIALAHRYVQNGDSMADPDMEVSVIPTMKMAEALSFQQDGVPGFGTVYQRVYPEPGKVNLRFKRDQNAFLADWLGNIISQGHRLAADEDKTEAPATDRPGDMAAIYAEESGIDYRRRLSTATWTRASCDAKRHQAKTPRLSLGRFAALAGAPICIRRNPTMSEHHQQVKPDCLTALRELGAAVEAFVRAGHIKADNGSDPEAAAMIQAMHRASQVAGASATEEDITAALVESLKRAKHFLSEIRAGNAFSPDLLWTEIERCQSVLFRAEKTK